jgi:hypothetical protein
MALHKTYTLSPSISVGAQGSPGQVLSLGSLTNSTAGFFNDLHIGNSPNIKKYEVIETTEDLLAMSCAWYRIRTDKESLKPHITSLVCEELIRHVTQEDRELANNVRDYYSKKFMVMALKDQRLTNFRQDLKEYLLGDSKKFTEKTIPMVYRMPEFYVHDQEFDVIKRDFQLTITNFSELTRRTTDRNVRLIPIKSFKKNSKLRGKHTEYWLKDSKNQAYRFGLRSDNPLMGLWDNAFNNGEMRLGINMQAARRDDLEFFNIGSIVSD